MEILTDNYIWIIVIVVVILMTIIGYIAEKTNFGKKEFSKKKNNKQVIEGNQEKKEEIKKAETPAAPVVETSEAEKKAYEFEAPERIIKPIEKEPEEVVQFRDPLTDDMNVSSKTLEVPYEENRVEAFPEEDLNVPIGENNSYDVPDTGTFEVAEDLNAPFGDFEIPSENVVEENLNVPLTEDVSYNSSYNMPEEDLNVPFGDNAEISSKEEDFGLNLPDIDSIKEDVSATINSENDDDDIWKF